MAINEFVLQASPREEVGKGPARRLRSQGLVPVIVYSHGKPGLNLSVKQTEVAMVAHHAGLLSINVENNKTPITAIIKDYQVDVLKRHLVHVDFQEVRADEVISATIPVYPHGTPAGEAHGGIFDQSLHEIEIRCPANQMPEQVDVDISELDLDAAILAGDIKLPEGVELETDAEAVIFNMYIPRETEEEELGEAEEAEAAEGQEPEVISKGKETEEGEE